MKKFISFLLAFSLILVFSFGNVNHVAKAMTFDELVAQVVSLKSEIVSLKSMLTGSVLGAKDSVVVLKQGSKGDNVRVIQLALKASGYLSGRVDGIYGLVTAKAVEKYQSAYGLKVNGIVDKATKFSILKEGAASTSSKEGEEKKGVALCLNRVSASVNSTTKYLGFTLGVNSPDVFLYVIPGEKPSLFPYNALEDDINNGSLYPHSPYVSGSATSRLNLSAIFEYYKDNYPDGSFDLIANPDTGIDASLGKVYVMYDNGTKYYSLDLSSLPEGTPNCTTPTKTFEGVVNFGTCTDGIQNGDETGIDSGGRCDGSVVTQNTSFAHWSRENNPVNLGIVNNSNVIYSTAFNKSKIGWDASPVINFTEGNQIRVVSAIYNEPWLTSTLVTIKSVLHSDGAYRSHLTDVEVRLNDKYLAGGGQYDSDAWRLYSVCRGIGHALGLNNSNVNKIDPNLGTCMDYTIDPAGISQQGPLNNMYPSVAIDFPAIKQAHHENPGDSPNKPAEGLQSQTVVYTIPLPI